MGQEITPEAIELMQERIDNGFAKKRTTTCLVTEIHRNIILDEPISNEELQPKIAIEPNETDFH